MVLLVERHAERAEADSLQRGVHCFRVRHEHVEVDRGSQPWCGIAAGDVGALQQDRDPVVSGADTVEQGRGCEAHRGCFPFELDELRVDRPPLSAPAPGGVQVHAMRDEVGDLRLVDQRVDTRPHGAEVFVGYLLRGPAGVLAGGLGGTVRDRSARGLPGVPHRGTVAATSAH